MPLVRKARAIPASCVWGVERGGGGRDESSLLICVFKWEADTIRGGLKGLVGSRWHWVGVEGGGTQ